MTDGPVEQRLPFNPTVDVEDTIEWLRANEFMRTESRGPEGMGFQRLVYERSDGTRVRLLTDRGQWMADISLPGWDRWFDLDIIVNAMSGASQWQKGSGTRVPTQLPPGRMASGYPAGAPLGSEDAQRRVTAPQAAAGTGRTDFNLDLRPV